MLRVKGRENSMLFRGDGPNFQVANTMMTVKEISLESLLTMDRACSGRLRGEKQVEMRAMRGGHVGQESIGGT